MPRKKRKIETEADSDEEGNKDGLDLNTMIGGKHTRGCPLPLFDIDDMVSPSNNASEDTSIVAEKHYYMTFFIYKDHSPE
jgi:hypothetical protein